jgi:hypothetical protein
VSTPSGKTVAALCAAALAGVALVPVVERWLDDPASTYADAPYLVRRSSALTVALEAAGAGRAGALVLLLPVACVAASALVPADRRRWRQCLAGAAVLISAGELALAAGAFFAYRTPPGLRNLARAAGRALGLGHGINMPAALLPHSVLASVLAGLCLAAQLRGSRLRAPSR